ncbi:hypothetical protein FSHL1_006981 [Fusarium sambucinum]
MYETPLPTETATSNPPGHDIFCTPDNSSFVHQIPYQPLNTAEREIRLLKVFPDPGSENKYLALSYCAGSAKNTRYISVNNACCNVFANLHHALMEARHYWETHASQRDLLLWVDQICINQYDLNERSHQVSFMRDIYEGAKETLICLSTPESHGDGMKSLIMQRRDLVLDDVGASLRINYVTRKKAFESRWAASLDVAMSPWWNRAWVFQEFMVSTQATFLYGCHSMSYLDLAISVAALPGPETPHLEDLAAAIEVPFKEEKTETIKSRMKGFLVAKLKQSRTNDLKLLLSYTASCQATDKRDKIYSILGLADPGYGIVPDYSDNTDINDLVVETTKKIILFDDSLEVLSYKNPRKPFCIGPRGLLPSWVLDPTDSTSFIDLYDMADIADCDTTPKFVVTQPDGTTSSSPDALFLKVPHPQRPKVQIEGLHVWAAFLDDGFYRIGNESGRYWPLFRGSRGFRILQQAGLEEVSEYELWAIRGTLSPFLLVKYHDGYQIVTAARCFNLDEKTKRSPDLSQIKTRDGQYDISKMQETRITIF